MTAERKWLDDLINLLFLISLMSLLSKRGIERIVENDQIVSVILSEKAGVGQGFVVVVVLNKVITCDTKEVSGYPEELEQGKSLS